MAEHKIWDVFYGGSSVAILSEAECREAADKVHAARDIWVEREVVKDHPIKFHTLGGATYLDLDKPTYRKHIDGSAESMRAEFGDLYDALCVKLAEPLQGEAGKVREVVVAADLAPPGFHIYQGNPQSGVGLAFGGRIHCDAPHLEHRDKYPDMQAVLSFTLPIALPAGGSSGMYYWTGKMPEDAMGFAFEKTPQQYAWLEANKNAVTYKLGELVLHDGTTPHQLANMCKSDFSDWRITLQGHGILSQDKWHIYF